MQPLVSVCLPVQNAQAGLAARVERVLDVVSELVDRFDLLIVDDGSCDDTIEVAHELARRYPQVAAVRHDRPLGLQQAIQTGLNQCGADVLLIEAEDGRFQAVASPKCPVE